MGLTYIFIVKLTHWHSDYGSCTVLLDYVLLS